MKLLMKALKKKLPALYTQDELGADAIVHAKFFTPDSNWTWYVLEGQAEDNEFRFFGIVDGFATEYGYFVLSELEKAKGPLGLGIERDLYWEPTLVREIPELHNLCIKMGYIKEEVK